MTKTTAGDSSLAPLLQRTELYTTLYALDRRGTSRNKKQHVTNIQQRQAVFQFYATVSAVAAADTTPMPAPAYERAMEQKGVSLSRSNGFYWNDRGSNKKKKRKADSLQTTNGVTAAKSTRTETNRRTVSSFQEHPQNRSPTMTPEQYLKALNARWNTYARAVLGIDGKQQRLGSRLLDLLVQGDFELRGALVQTHPLVQTTTSKQEQSEPMVIVGESQHMWRLVAMKDSQCQRTIIKRNAALTLLIPADGENATTDGGTSSTVSIRLESAFTNDAF